ncbi:MAG: YcaQ family DNA glycosylase [Chloroflexi bacterium]|nr:YcaQ family DNA glycosylase [Chloroflexota bacterium]
MSLTLSKSTLRQFVLGKQGLYPGRRWHGKAGAAQAISSGSVVQVDPLNVIARNHDLVLHSRVLQYQPKYLDELLYAERKFFDYGGTVMIQPMEELPYWRVVMARKQNEPRRVAFAAEHGETIEMVLAAVEAQGALGTRDFKGVSNKTGSFRSSKVTSQALYYLWIAGELMTHSRRGFDRVYDLRDRIAPPDLCHSVSADEADDFFALKIFQYYGTLSRRSWRNVFAGTIERKVDPAEAVARLDAFIKSGRVTTINIADSKENPRYVLAEEMPMLESLQAGRVPDSWRTIESTTADEMVFLAPLEIVSTRGRALFLFDFEYLWEVYKPQAKRRWGYYTLPILYGDRLVARMDPKLDRPSKTLIINGFWLENNINLDEPFARALIQGLRRFMDFLEAESIDTTGAVSSELRALVSDRL